MQDVIADIDVDVSPMTKVMVGESAVLSCQYSGVHNESFLTTKWEYRQQKQAIGTILWIFYGNLNVVQKSNFEILTDNILEGHSIKIKKAQISDSGIYICGVEYLEDGANPIQKRPSTSLQVLGKVVILMKINCIKY